MFFGLQISDLQQQPELSTPLVPGKQIPIIPSIADHYLSEVRLLRSSPSASLLTSPPGISPSMAAQVVHSAGRRFIVSPVPESRLREQFVSPPSANTSFGDEPSPGKKYFCFTTLEGILNMATECLAIMQVNTFQFLIIVLQSMATAYFWGERNQRFII